MGKQALSYLDGRWNRNSIPLFGWLTVCVVLLHRVSPRAFALRLRVYAVHERASALKVQHLRDVRDVGILHGRQRCSVYFAHLWRTMVCHAPSLAETSVA